MRRADGKLAQWIVIDTDITRRRETEDALRKAKETAEKNSQLKSEFLANMSHEIRTPLNAIIGMTDLALATDLSDEQREYLQTVRSSGESLLTLLNDILDLSKIEAGKMELEEVDFDLREVVQDAVRTLQVRATQKGLALTSHLADNLTRSVRGDPTKLRQVLVNLIGNAIKFTEQGEVTVTVEPMWRNEDELGLHFAVRDTGIGIPAEKRDEIFQPFRQSDASTTRRFGGSGLGLTISSEMVRMMQGRIWVDSTPGRGSIFHFTIQLRHGAPLALPPATRAGDTPADTPESKSGDAWKDAPRVRPLRVLIADDHAANRHLVTSVLERRGHDCTQVTNGRDAVDAYQSEPFDVLLMDVQMPVLDGYQATAQIRRLEEHTRRHIPIVALTAHAMAGDREKCLAAGMDAYLAKPIRPPQLVQLVESVADLKPVTADRGTGLQPVSEANSRDNGPPETAGAGSPSHDGTAASPSHEAFDLDYALQSLDNDHDLLVDQMEFFLQDAPTLLAQADAAFEQQDPRQLQLSAHRLKGMLARYACREAAELAAQLEQHAASGDLAAARQLLPQLAPRVEQLRSAIDQYLAEHQP